MPKPVTVAAPAPAPAPASAPVPTAPALDAATLRREGALAVLATLRANFAGHGGTYSAASIVAAIDELAAK